MLNRCGGLPLKPASPVARTRLLDFVSGPLNRARRNRTRPCYNAGVRRKRHPTRRENVRYRETLAVILIVLLIFLVTLARFAKFIHWSAR